MATSERETCPYPFGEPHALDMHPRYGELRSGSGMARVQMAYGQPAWLATRYDDVRTVLGDPRFSRAQAVGDDEPRVLPFVQRGDSLFTTDPPEHSRLRTAVARAFTKRRVDAMRPGIEAVMGEQIDEMVRGDPTGDLVREFALPASIKIICSLLGVPFDERDHFRSLADVILVNSPDAAGDVQQIMQAQLDLREYLGGLVAARRTEPKDDLLGVLTQVDEDERLSDDEIIGIGVDVLIAGHETSSNFISNFVYVLLTHDLYRGLVDDPGLVPGAVDELLRIVPLNANAFMARVATEDVELGGELVRAGEPVLPSMASANVDEAMFADPTEIDFGGRSVSHLGFGHGVHRCLGAQLGRMELEIALGSLVRRLPDLRLAVAPEDVPWRSMMMIRGLWSLPVTW